MGHILSPSTTFVYWWPLSPCVPSLRWRVNHKRVLYSLPSKLCEWENTRLARFWPTISGAVPEGIVCVWSGVDLKQYEYLPGFYDMHPYHGVVSCTTRLIHGHCPGVCGVCIRPFRRRTFFSTHLPPQRKLNGRLHIATMAELTIPEVEMAEKFVSDFYLSPANMKPSSPHAFTQAATLMFASMWWKSPERWWGGKGSW